MAGRASIDRPNGDDSGKTILTSVRPQFRKAVGTAFLPLFACREDKNRWRPVSYAMDIEAHIDWSRIDLVPLLDLPLSKYKPAGETFAVGMARDGDAVIRQHDVHRLAAGVDELDPFYLSRVLSDDLIPNPWVANEVTEQVLAGLSAKHGGEMVAGNFVYIVEQAKQHVMSEKNRLAKLVFEDSLEKDRIRFTIIADETTFRWFKSRQVRDAKRLTDKRGQPLQNALFDVELEDAFNELEQAVAWFLEEQNQLYFWWRNIPHYGYFLQGWQKGRIFPDFIFATDYDGKDDFKVFVVETKGIHLKNEDTDYKKAVFSMANQKSKAMKLDQGTMAQAIKQHPIKYAVVHSNEWQKEFVRMTEG